MGIFNLDIAV